MFNEIYRFRPGILHPKHEFLRKIAKIKKKLLVFRKKGCIFAYGFGNESDGPGRFPVKKQTMKQNYNKHEIAMLGLIREEIDILVGGYENAMLDSPVDSQDYKDAYNYLYETPARGNPGHNPKSLWHTQSKPNTQ